MSSPEEDTLRGFVFEKVLNQDTRAKSVNLLGKIDSQPAILIAEKTAFNVEPEFLETFAAPSSVSALSLIQRNDIYHWFLASQVSGMLPQHAEAKLTLIYPATETHIRKYSSQSLRMVTETSEAYRDFVLPYVASKREDGRLNWVYNILDKKAESDTIIIEDTDEREGFMLLPDLHVTRYPQLVAPSADRNTSKWDSKTMSSLYTMALVRRRDITSIRDLKKKDAPWLRRIQHKILHGICQKFREIEEDQIKLYVHYHPSYYHFHLHAVAVSHDGGGGQIAGRALLLQNVISQLENMSGDGDAGFAQVDLTYFLGEESELWQNVFSKLKENSQS